MDVWYPSWKTPFWICQSSALRIGTRVKPLTKVNIQPGSSVPCKQWENIELLHVNEVSGKIFQPVENSSGAV